MKRMVLSYENLEVVPLGLCVLQPKPWYGASPDSAVFCTCCGYGVVEVKCPYSLRDKSLREEVLQNRFYIGHSANGYFLQRKHNYYFQVQHEMSVTGTTYCDFIVWTPTESVIFRIEKDQSFIDNMYEKCDRFWMIFILPELVTHKLEDRSHATQSTSTSVSTVESNKQYCVLNRKRAGEQDEMVGCDSCDNWFHPVCIGLKTLPKSKQWYCKSCKKARKES